MDNVGIPGKPGNANLPIGALKPLGILKPANQEIGVPGDGVPRNDVPGKWHSRGYLPHYETNTLIQHVTFHLADSLPKEVAQRMEEELNVVPAERQEAERRKRMEAWIDSGHGSCVLREPEIARMVEDSLLFSDAQRYRLMAWVVMPNHMHVLFQPMQNFPVAKIVASWKKFTATRICAFHRASHPGNANLPIGDSSLPVQPVWHREYWDRFIRDERHFHQVLDYIHQNPAKAGLVARAEDWPWGSARFGQECLCGQRPEIRQSGDWRSREGLY